MCFVHAGEDKLGRTVLHLHTTFVLLSLGDIKPLHLPGGAAQACLEETLQDEI